MVVLKLLMATVGNWECQLEALGQSYLVVLQKASKACILSLPLWDSQFQTAKDRFFKLVVGSFIRKKLPFGYVNDMASKTWKSSEFEMKSSGGSMYTFEFNKECTRKVVLDKRSFFISSHLFIICWTQYQWIKNHTSMGAMQKLPSKTLGQDRFFLIC